MCGPLGPQTARARRHLTLAPHAHPTTLQVRAPSAGVVASDVDVHKYRAAPPASAAPSCYAIKMAHAVPGTWLCLAGSMPARQAIGRAPMRRNRTRLGRLPAHPAKLAVLVRPWRRWARPLPRRTRQRRGLLHHPTRHGSRAMIAIHCMPIIGRPVGRPVGRRMVAACSGPRGVRMTSNFLFHCLAALVFFNYSRSQFMSG